MPAKFRTKSYVADSYYHLFNRGVEKRVIFMDEQDYAVFLSYIKTYLLVKDTEGLQKIILNEQSSWKQKHDAARLLRLNNFSDSLTLVSYCLMPNHFHLLVHQKNADTIDRFMNSLCTRYSMYFNKKYHRVGPLFQGLYKAVSVLTDEQLLHLTRYIHRNPASKGRALQSYAYSSYAQYLGEMHADWVHPEDILGSFGRSFKNTYQSFVEDVGNEEDSFLVISKVSLDVEDAEFAK